MPSFWQYHTSSERCPHINSLQQHPDEVIAADGSRRLLRSLCPGCGRDTTAAANGHAGSSTQEERFDTEEEARILRVQWELYDPELQREIDARQQAGDQNTSQDETGVQEVGMQEAGTKHADEEGQSDQQSGEQSGQQESADSVSTEADAMEIESELQLAENLASGTKRIAEVAFRSMGNPKQKSYDDFMLDFGGLGEW